MIHQSTWSAHNDIWFAKILPSFAFPDLNPIDGMRLTNSDSSQNKTNQELLLLIEGWLAG